MIVDPGSFRDPSGYVFSDGNRVFRRVRRAGQADLQRVQESVQIRNLVRDGGLIAFAPAPDNNFLFDDDDVVLEHPKVPFISYPYEWPFEMLRAAAMLHLDLQIQLLDEGISLKDATAFNIQFLGTKPIFIDLLSFRQYVEGEAWMGHRQFVEQFLNPLVLRAVMGLPYHDWYRGSISGIDCGALSRLMSLRQKLSPVLMGHVVLPAWVERSLQSRQLIKSDAASRRHLGSTKYRAILLQLRRYIETLRIVDQGKSTWQDYENNNTYCRAEADKKKAFVREFVAASKPDLLLDLGCNSGEYSEVACEMGAGLVVGVDGDEGALRATYSRAVTKGLALLPIYQDLTNPSPSNGWNSAERASFWARAEQADALLALALIHHLVIGGNIPVKAAVERLVSTAPCGVIEFVPKGDPTVNHMLATREDVFADYTEERFVDVLQNVAKIVRSDKISDSGRTLFWFARH